MGLRGVEVPDPKPDELVILLRHGNMIHRSVPRPPFGRHPLESVRIGGRLFTTAPALDRFLQAGSTLAGSER